MERRPVLQVRRAFAALACVLAVTIAPAGSGADPVEAGAAHIYLAYAWDDEIRPDGTHLVRAVAAISYLHNETRTTLVQLVKTDCTEDRRGNLRCSKPRARRVLGPEEVTFVFDPALETASASFHWRGRDREITWTGVGDRATDDPVAADVQWVQLAPKIEVCAQAGVGTAARRDAQTEGTIFGRSLGDPDDFSMLFQLAGAAVDVEYTSGTGQPCCGWSIFCR